MVFILPFGLTTTARVERRRRRHSVLFQLITGIFLTALGAGLLLLSLFTGLV